MIERDSPGNYRPSSLTSVSWKISSWKPLLSSWRARRWSDAGSINLWKRKLSLITLTGFHGKVTGSVDKGRVVNIVYLHFSKAFPKVFDIFLTTKMVRYGQDKQMIRWMENWLNCQAERVVIGSTKSNRQLVASGSPPQGLILELMLFDVFIVNDLDHGRECTLSKFMEVTCLQGNSWYVRGQGCYSQGPGQARGMGCQEPHQAQQRQMWSPLLGMEEPLATAQGGGQRTKEQLCRKGPGVLVDMVSMSTAGANKANHILDYGIKLYNQQVHRSNNSSLFGTCETASRILFLERHWHAGVNAARCHQDHTGWSTSLWGGCGRECTSWVTSWDHYQEKLERWKREQLMATVCHCRSARTLCPQRAQV